MLLFSTKNLNDKNLNLKKKISKFRIFNENIKEKHQICKKII